jgi:hypothetical protein
MPNYIAHIHFAREAQKLLPGGLKELCAKYQDIYDYGSIGPDFLFALRETGSPAARYTNIMQLCNIYGTFRAILERLKAQSDERELVYVMGLLCHYVADFRIHPYVNFFAEQGFIKNLLLGYKPFVHAQIEAAFDYFIVTERMKNPDFRPAKVLKMSKQSEHAVAALYYNAINPVVGFDISIKTIIRASRITRLFIHLMTDTSGKKRKIYEFLEKHIFGRIVFTANMIPPVGYGKTDYLNLAHRPFRIVRDRDQTSTMSFPELFDDAVPQAAAYMKNFYNLVVTGGSLEDMGGYEAFKISFEGTTTLSPTQT